LSIIGGGNLDEARRMNAHLCLFNIMPFASDSENNKGKKTASCAMMTRPQLERGLL
jgi:hypothetical protein